MKTRLPIVVFILLALPGMLLSGTRRINSALTSGDTIRIACYNMLNYPGTDNAIRDPYFRRVYVTMNPDALVTEEMQPNNGQATINHIRDSVLNYYQSGLYSSAPFQSPVGPNSDTQTGFFFKSSKITYLGAHTFISGTQGGDRDVTDYMIRINSSSDTLHLLGVHLKADQGSPYDTQRGYEADSIRKYLNTLSPGAKFLIMGDFNTYSSTEPCLQVFLESETNNNGRAKDPLNPTNQSQPWHNTSTYAPIHTQSPRTRAFGGGSTGGMDDRFDIILTSYSALDNNIVTSHYIPYGNDGKHFNDSINRLPNLAVPDSVANALEYSSDHLPVYCDFVFAAAAAPGSFTLLSPSNGATNQSVSGTLNWNSSQYANSYDVYLSTSNPPTTIVSTSQSDTTYAYSGLSPSALYYWKVISKNGTGTDSASNAPFSFTTAPAPGAFALTSPSNGATGQQISGTLSWGSSTNATGYDVYLGTVNPPTTIVSANQAGTSYPYSGLSGNATYYWKVVAKGLGGSTTATGSPWNFETIPSPGAFSLLSPSNSSTNQPVAGSLTWQSSANATGYDVYLGTVNPPTTVVSSNQPGTSYSYGPLANTTTYYWKVVAKNGGLNTTATGSPWGFTTIISPPGAFSLTSPSNSAGHQPLSGNLTWQASTNAAVYHVYFGTTNPPPLVSSSQSSTTFPYSSLNTNTTYYWSIVAVNAADTTIATAAPWSFTTIVPPGAFNLETPSSGSANVLLSGTMTWGSSANATSYDFYLDVNNPPLVKVDSNLVSANRPYSGLLPNTTYYWNVAARNGDGTVSASNGPFQFSTIDAPAKPLNLLVSQVGLTSLGLQWTDTATNETGFRVYRATSGSGPFSQVGGDLPANTESFSDTGLGVNIRYYYRVTAFNGVGEGDAATVNSSTLAAIPGTPTVTAVSGVSLKVVVNPSVNPTGTAFAIEISKDSVVNYVQSNSSISPVAQWNAYAVWGGSGGITVSGLQLCTSYSVAVKARNGDGVETAFSGSASQTLTCSSISGSVMAGWNLLSIPAIAPSFNRADLFPTSSSNAFYYSHAYQRTDTMNPGIGYWLKFDAPAAVTIIGDSITADTVNVASGWNMIGVLASPVPVGSVVQDPGIILASNYFGYNGSYVIADTLHPLQGYWVKANTSGRLIISAGGSHALPKAGRAISDAGRISSLTFGDGDGEHSGILQIDEAPPTTSPNVGFEMPPLGPATQFDVRFADGTYRTGRQFESAKAELPVLLQSHRYPVTLSWSVFGTKEYTLTIDGASKRLSGSGSMVIRMAPNRIVLSTGGDSRQVPASFSLCQNYPNPFNPSTDIRYDIPERSMVRLTVYSTLGVPVTTLVQQVQDAGEYHVVWHPNVASGVYFYRIEATSNVHPSFTYERVLRATLMK
ncbi:MAG TPA: T9SS type A sorting domain-containing protein [Bacteroidota bacterium]|nr:T9SS type A sorting domain-containing protein [Bacteroidota bacterium]